jgi:predicted HTH domain antitoxin
MTATLSFDFPSSLLLRAKDEAALRERSRFLLALKYFEMEELSSGQAAALCGMERVPFLLEAARYGVPAFDLSTEELEQEFANG